MAAPRETIWELKPHSLGKHLVLKEYLKAWLPILGQTQGRILFLDGFAGPGEYKGGEQGSPVIARILAHPKSEIYISVMYEHINRFRGSSEFCDPLDSLYGCDDWRAYVDLDDGRERRRGLFDLYKRQLRQAGAEHVVHFDLYDRGQHKYSIFHASRHPRASNEMKAAIWSVDPGGGFVFHGGQTEQLALGVEPNFRPLQDALRCEFRGDRWVTIEEIEAFVMSDKTDYHLSQLRKHALIPMEHRGDLRVKQAKGEKREAQASLPGLFDREAAPRRKRPTYPAGTELRIS